MKFISTRDPHHERPVSFFDAVLQGLAPDGGLYMPDTLPVLTEEKLKLLPGLNLSQLAFEMLYPFLENEISASELITICEEVFNFPLPLVRLDENLLSLELFHGPTLAFKDFGARFMARVLSRLAGQRGGEIRVVVATSGDTGSAVAAGFYKVPGIKVFILYPKGRVSPGQQKQLTTWGENITALEIEGSFDDCQRHVKSLLADASLQQQVQLTSANSINLARLLPQMVYYAAAWAQLSQHQIAFSVPSGNFGNLTAGLMAAAMGIPVKHFVAATNVNDVVPQYLHEGIYQPRPSATTLSNAMDVGNPSNFERMLHLFGHQHQRMQQRLSGAGFTDVQTLQAMQQLYGRYGYVADPHGAVGYLGAAQYLNQYPDAQFVFLETAHPAKFPETVNRALGFNPEMPERLQAFLEKKEQQKVLPNEIRKVREVVLMLH
jgi:threonine synthase|nr:threonine synthase [Bacteroidia bacterium]